MQRLGEILKGGEQLASLLKRAGLALLMLFGSFSAIALVALAARWNSYAGLAGAAAAIGLVVLARRRWAEAAFERRFSTALLLLVFLLNGTSFLNNFDGEFGSQSEAARAERAAAKAKAEAEKKESAARAEREAEERRQREAAELVTLRKTDPDEYLKRLRAFDIGKWIDEVKILRPKQYAAYQEEVRRQNEAAEAERQRKTPVNYLTLEFNWSKGGFDSVMIGHFTIKSALQFEVRDIKIACVTAGASGTALSTVQQTIYDYVPAKSTKRFPNVNMGFINTQSASANCQILSVR